MAQLIQMRQRIKAIETIKKVTHAMRLISMSLHSRLRGKTPLLKNYNDEISNIFKKLRLVAPDWKSPITHPEVTIEDNPLFILVGSQKGLCGTFNTSLIKNFETIMPETELKKINFITIGKKAVDYLAKQQVKTTVKQFNEISARNFTIVSNEIVRIIVNAEVPYTSVKILSNELKTFFLQKPRLFQLIPLTDDLGKEEENQDFKSEYIWHQEAYQLLDNIAPQYIASNINAILMESILAEQAARFISMDTATRNAKNLLEETTLQYNKLRQAKITKELTELATNF